VRLEAAFRAAAGIAVLCTMDAFIKIVAGRYPTFEVAFLRFAAGSVVALLAVAALRPGWPSRETVVANAGRAALGVVTATTFFYALGQLPLAETLVLTFLSPMFTALFSVLLLGERADRRILTALGAGFVGTLVVVSGQIDVEGQRSLSGVVAALVSAVCYAFGLVLLRARAQRDHFIVIVAFQNVGPMLIIAPFAAAVWTPPASADLALFLLIGVFGVAGHVLLTTAFARAEAARLAPLEYTALIWAGLLGYFVFDEVPTLATALGAALIVAGAALATRR
jgi:drug/metabolite transporter (DMT)-like permease